ncbi:tRNA N(3)-methylcytidine methyltransferase METTL6-like [Pecten maximus]|uniref:tRNA N(3)-methylcytidine methyltransferase METTL6-like n=1 Tax=Pecten maximus TaxID=6579 RepID=UPI00145845B1|nr:tRNA N(3)-methylcytidine methyltransferase METTL6-like [Pecten maximus]XP_033762194.1 tRNA N(3)-methylcytidine methyltransferase METTL6-like [Pecten maximus]XP_033762195.1 tRNA N(3)-methylcytidine methyltransferase METTL6-like [Pecten maximus]XP_033762196.1 tRNA N(3)-methylcytidine methyltransferase METTL6-like [Pecten maximus]XP_033762197.1 tRNA N(3)-methylcytidine methyltransferase METTL6-like [Pecten maximus]XP_033762198.1 tRNA N(3)-methylcytidine methyltransferase METTL6-like [Pecten ma
MASCNEKCDMEDTRSVILGHSARVLTKDEKQKLEKDDELISEFKRNKYELEAKKNWDLFYKRNTTKFFKDRHWTTREFNELCSNLGSSSGTRVILEVGCGVGNFIFPLLEQDSSLYFHACDFSPRAVQFVKENPLYDPERCNVFQCDITTDPLTNHMPENSVNLVSMIFVLSAINPEKMTAALSNIVKVLRPGGLLLFRDYGLYDYAMLRFQSGHKLSENFYVRQDGTRAYYFSTELLMKLVSEVGLTVCECEYVQRETVNRKEGLSVPRIFVQGKFVKPNQTDNSALNESDSRSPKTCKVLTTGDIDCQINSQNTYKSDGRDNDTSHIISQSTDGCDTRDNDTKSQTNSQNTDGHVS